MMRCFPVFVFALLFIATTSLSLAQAAQLATTAELRTKALRWFAPLPDKHPQSAGDNAALVHLGRSLFNERLLSQQLNQSCASCHRLSQGIGALTRVALDRSSSGETTLRNTPSLLNSALQNMWHWDGGASSLEQQAAQHLLDPYILGMPNEAGVMKRLNSNPSYEVAFSVAYKGAQEKVAELAPTMSFAHTLEALAAYQRSLLSHDRFDEFLNGEDQALSANEQRGLAHFIQLGCVQCHQGALLGGTQLAKLGVKQAADEFLQASDLGRYQVTQQEEDKAVFKVPSLRNVALTAPYFHAGQVAELKQAVALMARLQLGVELSEQQLREIIAFLNSLTDSKQL